MPKRLLHLSGLIVLLSSVFILFSSFNTAATEWKFDPAQAKIHFEIPGYHKQGSFSGLRGSFFFDPAFPEQARIDATIPVATVETGNHMLDWHLKTKSYFDAKNYPDIVFYSVSISKSDTCYYADGELKMKGVEKNVRLQFWLTEPGTTANFTGRMEVDAGDFGVGHKNKKGKDKVIISIEVPITKSSS